MAEVNKETYADLNKQTPAPEAPPITVGAFWQTVYFPWVQANKRASTVRGYEIDWNLYVKPTLETTAITSFRPVDACELLDGLASKLNESTLAHVRSLLSGIFKRACAKGIINYNPMRDAEISVRVRKAKPRIKYTPEETVAILNAITKPDAKLFFALVAVMGMRPSEVAGLNWSNVDFDKNILSVREAAPYGKLGDTKTERSKRDLTIIATVLDLLRTWHKACDSVTSGLLFTNGNGDPVNHNAYARRWIAPEAKKVCKRWCGLYSGRHGAATALYNLTGDMRAAYQVLGNSFEIVSKTYVEADVEQGAAGLSKYEATLKAVQQDEKR